MRLSFSVVVLIICFAVGGGYAQGHFKVTPAISTAYQSVLDLRFDDARQHLAEIKRSDPHNVLVYHIENYIDFFHIFISEDKATFDRLSANKGFRIKKIKSGDPNSPYYLFSQAEIMLQWATARSKFKQELKAGLELNRAYKLLKENQEKFPDFELNKKSLSVIHALIGSVSGFRKGLIKLFSSLDGSVEQGLREMDELYAYAQQHPTLFDPEIQAIEAMMSFHVENNAHHAWEVLQASSLDHKQSPLAAYLWASMALKTGRNDQAIDMLTDRPHGDEYFSFLYLDLMLGKAKLNRLDSDAHLPLTRFIQGFRGQNYIKEAYQKLAWHALLIHNNPSAYRQYMKHCEGRGNTFFGEDEQALKEAKRRKTPNEHLLRTRLLFDGGYYDRAYNILVTHAKELVAQPSLQLEYHYRLGRITHQLKNYQDAIISYAQAIQLGKQKDAYYACNAAFQIGLIFEDQGEYKRAKHYYETCLSIRPDEHRASLHQKAKVALERIRKY